MGDAPFDGVVLVRLADDFLGEGGNDGLIVFDSQADGVAVDAGFGQALIDPAGVLPVNQLFDALFQKMVFDPIVGHLPAEVVQGLLGFLGAQPEIVHLAFHLAAIVIGVGFHDHVDEGVDGVHGEFFGWGAVNLNGDHVGALLGHHGHHGGEAGRGGLEVGSFNDVAETRRQETACQGPWSRREGGFQRPICYWSGRP